ncbi:MAG TPA: ankyrin repeat domain-containing protein [Streptomyces sp.]|nr:ankyrin repeat domain-containing protein [Streptomyces sp.]
MRMDSRDLPEPRADWKGMSWRDWQDPGLVRSRLAAGADPNGPLYDDVQGIPLHRAADSGSREVVAELAALVRDVDAADEQGQTALWFAVGSRQAENAVALLEAGADAWRPVVGGWSPGRLALLSPFAAHFENLPGAVPPSPAEHAAMLEADRLCAELDDVWEGLGVAFVAGVDEDEVIRRLGADPAECPVTDVDDAWPPGEEELLEDIQLVGVTGVEGGCVVSQPWGYLPEDPHVLARLSAGTVAYGIYLNAKSGDQAMIGRDGVCDRDAGAGLGVHADHVESDGGNVLLRFLYDGGIGGSVGYGCAYTGLNIPDARPITGPFRRWVRVPHRE